MSTEVIVSLFTFLTACVGSGRYLAGYWFKQQALLRMAEKKVYSEAITGLGKTLDEKGSEIRNLTYRLKEFEAKLNELIRKSGANSDKLQLVATDMGRITRDTEERAKQAEKIIAEIRGQIISIGKDVVMLKGNKP